MDQPVPTYREADLERVVSRDYAPAADEARAILARLRIDGRPASLRIRMACLKLGAGRLDALQEASETAEVDFRDVLAAAEYPAYLTASDADARRRAIASDWQQLQDWLQR
jgi:hypothetical protein